MFEMAQMFLCHSHIEKMWVRTLSQRRDCIHQIILIGNYLEFLIFRFHKKSAGFSTSAICIGSIKNLRFSVVYFLNIPHLDIFLSQMQNNFFTDYLRLYVKIVQKMCFCLLGKKNVCVSPKRSKEISPVSEKVWSLTP